MPPRVGAHDPAGVEVGAKSARTWTILERVVRDGIVFLAPDGHLEYANGPARRLLSGDTGEIERLASVIQKCIAEQDDDPPHRIEVETQEGPRTLYVESSEIEEDDCAGRLFVLKDARTVEALQEDLYLANRMRGLGELYVSMAHDLKTPINAMTLTLDSLRDSLVERPLGEADESERLDYVDTVRDELTRFHRSIQAFLVQTSPPSDARRRFDVRRVVREALRFARPLAEGRDVRLRFRAAGPVLVLGFRDRLRQALLNVVVNAVEATPAGGEVRVEASAEKDWTLRVLDDGPGFRAELADRLFKMHFTTKPRGSGIGLFVARAAVVAHGGRIGIRNRPEGGAVVEIRLPRGARNPVTT